MPKRKDHALHQTTDVSVQPNTNATSKDANTDLESLPIPIQNFLWRQFSPFVRPYNRKLQEASCVTFERILVQNNLHGLSPSLSDAILSIPRWRFIVAALPYVMHCCASTLESQPRRSLMHSAGDADREDPSASGQPSSAPPAAPLGPNTTKLLYTLHYLLLDAVADCVDSARQERPVPTGRRSSLYPHHTGAPSTEPYLFPITSLQVLVYLFAPLLPQLDPSDFRSSERAGRTNRLENGLRLWQPLWEHRQPDIPLFTAPAKPTRHTNDTMSEMETVPSGLGNVGDIYTGAEVDEGFLLAEPERNVEEAAAAKEALHRAKTAPHSGAPLAHMSEICTLTTLETPVTLTPTLEYICEFCNTKIQPAEKELLRCKCGHRRRRDRPAMGPLLSSAATALAQQASLAASAFLTGAAEVPPLPSSRLHSSPIDKEFLHNKLEMSFHSQMAERRAQPARDVSVATLFDVAVLRCLYVPPWSEEGMFWALRYFYNRLLEIRDYYQRTGTVRQRSNSVPSVKKPSEARTPRRADYLAPKDMNSKRRRMNAEEAKPKFFIGGQNLSARHEDVSPASTPGLPLKHQDVMFSFGDEEKYYSSPTTTTKSALFPFSSSNPVTPKDRGPLFRAGKSYPKITITTENSPAGTASGGEEERGDGGEMGLHRSKTDSSIAYPLSEYQEARGATNLIQDDGQLNYQAVTRAILVALNERPSQRICDVALSLLEVLLDILLDVNQNVSVLPSHTPLHQLSPDTDLPSALPTASSTPQLINLDPTIFRLVLSCTTRIFVIIGCPYGCGKDIQQSRNNPVEYMRCQAYSLIHRLQTLNEPEAKRFFRNMFSKHELAVIVEFCHAFFSSCVSPVAQDQSRISKPMKKTLSWVASQATKPIITQLIDRMDVIKRPENMGLQNDLRSLLTYIKEAYDSVFRRVVMSGVMESQQYPPSSIMAPHQQQQASSQAGTSLHIKSRPDTPTTLHLQHTSASQHTPHKRKPLIRHSRLDSETSRAATHDDNELNDDSPFEGDVNASGAPASAGYLRGIFAKKQKVSLKPMQSRENSENNLKGMTGLKSPRVSISEDESIAVPHSPGARKKKHGLGMRHRWLKSPKSSMGSRDSRRGTLETSTSLASGPDGNSSGEGSRQQSLEKTQPEHLKHRLSFKSTGQISLPSLRHKRIADYNAREEEINGILRRSKSEEAPPGTTPSKTAFILNVRALTTGMRSLGVLLEFCPPGTLPEPSVLSAMLDLQAPVLARAAFLLECAQFVHRCNQGKWPDWIKLTSLQYRQSGLVGRLIAPSLPRKQNILQRTAGKVFYEWARSLTLRLDDVLKSEEVDPLTVVSPTLVVDEEDYFMVGGDNMEPGNCPFALKMAACQLLLEITAFLRETYRMLPRKEKFVTSRTHGAAKASAVDKRLASRRWSSVASTSGGASHTSIHSFVEHGQVHLFHTGHAPGERRISFMIADDNNSLKSSSSATHEEVEHRSHLLKSGRDRVRQHQHEGPQGRRRSFRLRKASQDDTRRRTGSIRSRKASSVSARSEVSSSSMEEVVSPTHVAEDKTGDRDVFGLDQETTEYSDHMPWLDSMITLCSRFSFICDHKKACTMFCFYRIMKSCSRLTWSMKRLNGDESVNGYVGKSLNMEDDEVLEVSHGQSGSQTPTTPSSHRKLRIFRKASHYAGIGRLSKTASMLEKHQSMESMNKLRTEPLNDTSGKDAQTEKSKSEEDSGYYPMEGEKSVVMMEYMRQQVLSLFAAPFSVLAKGFLIMDEHQLERMFPICWELLLVDDEEVASTASTLCIVCSVKISKFVVDFIRKEMNHEEAEERVDSVLKFQALWRYRYQVWIRLEDGAQSLLKVSQALNIDYTLPSPLFGRTTVDCPDAPWLPPTSIKIEEVAISQEEQSKNSNTLVAATQTRRKQLQESMNKALRAQEERIQRERERARITMLPVLKMAAIEPVPQQVVDDREEGDDGNLTAETGTVATHALTVQPVFPGSLAVSILLLVDLLEDADVDGCGICVGDLAFQTLWEGIVEDASLFLRYMLEKLSNKDKQGVILRKLRRLMGHMNEIPPHAAATLFNHLMGYCMSFVRSSNEHTFHGVEAVMSVLWHIVPSVRGISFKDIKAVLRREQCDPHLLLTANVPGAKKVVVHGPDLTSIPSQLPVQEDTRFDELLNESLEFFGIPDNTRSQYLLVDSKTGRAHQPTGFIRDIYFFRRSFYPQLNLVHMSEMEAFVKLQAQAYHTLFLEAQKVFLVYSLFVNAEGDSEFALQKQQMMLMDDGLTKIPNFPRKALECDVQFQHGLMGAEYLAIDVMHKYVWVQMIASLLTNLSKTSSEVQLSHTDIAMLISVLNGVLLLHCQDSAILRQCLATFITVSRNMKSLFATTGFLQIMPTILKMYAMHQTNDMVIEAIEFACSQFFVLHRNPFLLQLFGSAASLLELSANEVDAKPLKRSHVKKILFSLERYGRRQSKAAVVLTSATRMAGIHPLDHLDILEKVDTKKPLQPLDLCYQNDQFDFTPATVLTSAVSSCIAVISYDTAESPRGTQMLQVLRTLIHEEVWYDEKVADNAKSAKEELQKIIALAGSLKSLISSAETLVKNFDPPTRSPINPGDFTRQLGSLAPSYTATHTRDTDIEANRPRITVQETVVDTDSQWEFSSPRNHLLAIVAHFLTSATTRIRHLSKVLGDLTTRPPELIDVKSHIRLSEIAQALLKVAPYDKDVMGCEGLELYMTEILPSMDFSVEALKQTIQQLLRRVDKTFLKIMKKPSMRRDTNWTAAAQIIQGVTKLMCNNNLIALLPQLKSLCSNCISMTLSDHISTSGTDIPAAVLAVTADGILPVSTVFRQATIDLCAVYLQAGKEYCNLEQLCATFNDQFFRMVICFLLPLTLRIGSGGGSDLPPLRIEDLRYILRVLIQLLHPPTVKQPSIPTKQLTVNANTTMTRTSSNMSNPSSSAYPSANPSPANKQQEFSRKVAFLGLKVVVVCYEGRLGSEWLRLAKSIQDYGEKGNAGLAFWHFLEYTIVFRTALYVHLAPFAVANIDKKDTSLSDQELQVQANIRRTLTGTGLSVQDTAEAAYSQISLEVNALIDEYVLMSAQLHASRSPTQIAQDETSQGEETVTVHRLADFARFRAIGKRKDSTLQLAMQIRERASSSAAQNTGKRSPPLVIPVTVERTDETKTTTVTVSSPSKEPLITKETVSEGGFGLERRRSNLTRQRAQYGLGHGDNHRSSKSSSMKVNNVNEMKEEGPPEMVEMVQLKKPHVDFAVVDHVANNVGNNTSAKVVTVSMVNSNRRMSKEKYIPVRRQSVDSLNDDEQVSLLK